MDALHLNKIPEILGVKVTLNSKVYQVSHLDKVPNTSSFLLETNYPGMEQSVILFCVGCPLQSNTHYESY